MADEPKTPWGKEDRAPTIRELIDLVNGTSATDDEKAALREAIEDLEKKKKDGGASDAE